MASNFPTSISEIFPGCKGKRALPEIALVFAASEINLMVDAGINRYQGINVTMRPRFCC